MNWPAPVLAKSYNSQHHLLYSDRSTNHTLNTLILEWILVLNFAHTIHHMYSSLKPSQLQTHQHLQTWPTWSHAHAICAYQHTHTNTQMFTHTQTHTVKWCFAVMLAGQVLRLFCTQQHCMFLLTASQSSAILSLGLRVCWICHWTSGNIHFIAVYTPVYLYVGTYTVLIMYRI